MATAYDTIIVNQPFGIGDVIWSQTLVHELAEGKKIEWGVFPQYTEALNRAYPGITFTDYRHTKINYERRDEYVAGNARVIPLRWADAIMNMPYNQCMRAKYDLYHKDWRTWPKAARWQRNAEREQMLFGHFNINGPYNLVNNFAGTELQLRGAIKVNNGLPNINMQKVNGFSLFDWASIFENAANIYTISTSNIYLMEMLELDAEEIHYYRKPNETDFSSTEYILELSKHNYIFH